MAIRRILGLEHLPAGTGYGSVASGNGLALLDMGFSYVTPTGGSGYCQVSEAEVSGKTRKVMAFYRSSNSNTHKTNIRFPLSKAGITGAHDFYFATRIRNSVSNGIPLLSLISAGGTGGTATVLLVNSAIPTQVNLDPGHLFEMKIDAATGVVSRWIDGEALGDVTLAATVLAAFQAGSCWMGIGTQNPLSQPGGYDYWTMLWDTYFVEDTKDDTVNGFLGPVTIVPLTVEEVEGSTWSAVGANSIPEAYAAPLTNAASLNTPVARSTANNDAPLINKLSSPVSNGNDVFAVDIVAYLGKQLVGNTAVAKSILKSGQLSAPAVDTILSTTSAPVRITPTVLEKNLDGQRWTPESLRHLSVEVSSVGT